MVPGINAERPDESIAKAGRPLQLLVNCRRPAEILLNLSASVENTGTRAPAAAPREMLCEMCRTTAPVSEKGRESMQPQVFGSPRSTHRYGGLRTDMI
jgi:hypothetical protein